MTESCSALGCNVFIQPRLIETHLNFRESSASREWPLLTAVVAFPSRFCFFAKGGPLFSSSARYIPDESIRRLNRPRRSTPENYRSTPNFDYSL